MFLYITIGFNLVVIPTLVKVRGFIIKPEINGIKKNYYLIYNFQKKKNQVYLGIHGTTHNFYKSTMWNCVLFFGDFNMGFSMSKSKLPRSY